MTSKFGEILFFAVALFSSSAFSQTARETSSADKIECGIRGCTLECFSEGKLSNSYSGAKSITTEFLPGGVIRYTLEKDMSGRQIILVGPNSYICSVTKN